MTSGGGICPPSFPSTTQLVSLRPWLDANDSDDHITLIPSQADLVLLSSSRAQACEMNGWIIEVPHHG